MTRGPTAVRLYSFAGPYEHEARVLDGNRGLCRQRREGEEQPFRHAMELGKGDLVDRVVRSVIVGVSIERGPPPAA